MSKNNRGFGKMQWLTSASLATLVALLAAFVLLGDKATTVSAGGPEGVPGQIYDNGGLSTGPTSNSGMAAPAGTNWSEAQNDTGNLTESNTLAGVSCSVTATLFRCADDFIVPAGQTWTIDQVITFAYQTGFGGTTSPITGATIQIWNGRPADPGSSIIFGDTTTNRLAGSTDGSLFRIFNSAVPPPGSAPGTTRRVWRNAITVSPAQVLTAGTYWIDWNTSIGTAAHFAPPVTIPGTRGLAGWNARQNIGTGWQDVIDLGNPATAPDVPLDFPFKLMGSVVAGSSDPDSDFDGDGASDYAIIRNGTPASGPVTIPGTGTGAIPDGGPGCGPLGTAMDISFDASGVTGSITNVTVDMNMTHSWVGDINVKLIAPDFTEHVVFAGTGSTTSNGCGSANDLLGVYTFDNSGLPGWWELGNPFPVGTYQTTVAGDQASPPAGDATDMNAAFAAANPTGTWILRIQDGGGGDTGTVSAANLTLTTAAPLAFSLGRSIRELQKDPGFKPMKPAEPSVGSPSAGSNMVWYIAVNNGSDPARVTGFGEPATDSRVPEDYDGDGKDDIAVWRGLGPTGPGGGVLHSFNSATSTVSSTDFGIQGDNPTVIGDYDGDGKADAAVFRCPPGGGQCTFYFKGSAGGGEITYFNWGNSSLGAIRPYPGDFDGDGKNDFCIFQGGKYILIRSTDGGVEWINWGLPTDAFISPGDFDGDGKTDFMNSRVNGTNVEWWLLNRNGGQSTTIWGTIAIAGVSEFPAIGDYDGDGKTDIGIWRRDNSSNSNSFFYTLRSSDLSLQTFEWGSMGDLPVSCWNCN